MRTLGAAQAVEHEYEGRADRLPRRAASLLVAFVAAASCARPPIRPSAGVGTSPASYDVSTLVVPSLGLAVTATFAASPDWFVVDDDAAPFVHDVEYGGGGGWRAARREGLAWQVPCASGCAVRYGFALAEAAAQVHDTDTALAAGGLVVAPPSAWLLRPTAASPVGRLRFHVRTPAGTSFATGVRPSPDGAPDTFEADMADLEEASYAVFGSFRSESIASGSGRVQIVAAPRGIALAEDQVTAWVRSAVDGIADYYGRFPVDRVLVIVVPGEQAETRGKTLGGGGPAVLVRAGTNVSASTVGDDWVMTHELLHATLPSLAHEHAWLGEGIATYVEPIVRTRAGRVPVDRFWRDLIEGLPQGLPSAGDQGLDRTHTWGRTYWGGALLCFVVDVRIREVSGQKRSFDDALRAIAAAGGGAEHVWDVERFVQEADRATETTEMARAYRELALAPGTVDLSVLWRRLGVRLSGTDVVFDDTAPLASITTAITSRPKP